MYHYNNLAPFYNGQGWGFCDKILIVKIPCNYDFVIPFCNGLAQAFISNKRFIIKSSGR